MKRTTPTPAAIRAALAAQSLRTSARWLVHWRDRSPTVVKYQWRVPLSKVLSEHVACVAAEFVEHGMQAAQDIRNLIEQRGLTLTQAGQALAHHAPGGGLKLGGTDSVNRTVRVLSLNVVFSDQIAGDSKP